MTPKAYPLDRAGSHLFKTGSHYRQEKELSTNSHETTRRKAFESFASFRVVSCEFVDGCSAHRKIPPRRRTKQFSVCLSDRAASCASRGLYASRASHSRSCRRRVRSA